MSSQTVYSMEILRNHGAARPSPGPATTMDQLFVPNTMASRALDAAPADLLRASFDTMLDTLPPKKRYDADELGGLMFGPTGAAYLLLHLSARHPDMRPHGHDLLFWAQSYLDGDRGVLVLEDGRGGILGERLAYTAVRACVSRDPTHVDALLQDLPPFLKPATAAAHERFSAGWLYGRAGVLYLLRMVRHWVPASAASLDAPIHELARRTVDMDDDGQGHWLYQGTRCFGAAHGDIGTIVQIVLGAPSLAPRLADTLRELLDMQTPDGNWLQTSQVLDAPDRGRGQVQFCHGAPGFVFALQVLRPHFPHLQARIDSAIANGRRMIWTDGLLKKEPSLCHGILGNGL